MTGGRIDLTHGGGGRATAELVAGLFRRHLGNPILDTGDDGAVIVPPAGRLVMATDGHVIAPLFFPGGDIGALAVNGTVNDLAMMGARPLHLTAGFILEEGFPLADLERIAASMGRAARAAGVTVVAGDTKVVEKGKGDGVFITTAGLGVLADGICISAANARPGMAVLVSGSLGDHGVAVLSQREGLAFEADILSDCAALNGLVATMLAAVPEVAVLRDPTRGGLSAALNEIAAAAGVGITLDEAAIPVAPTVAAACELLGLDPLDTANEGKLVALCPADRAVTLLAAMRAHPLGREAAIIGSVTTDAGQVRMRTAFGGLRMVDWLQGEQLPRIC